MNIIYFNTHDSGRYISPYGHHVPTETIDTFARDNILFRQAYCASPTCSPSRGALLSGMYPHSNGLIGLSHRGFSFNDYKQHIGYTLRNHGYHMAIAGTEHIANIGLFKQHEMNYDVLPYDDIIGPPGEENDIENANKVAEYIKGYNQDKPFFISFGLWNTHRKYPESITKGYEPDYISVPYQMLDSNRTREDFAHYCTSISIVDQCFKQILNALKVRGIYDDTIVIFTTDHGLPNPYMKANLYDSGIGVSLIMHIPGYEKKVINSLISQIDIVPTILEILDIQSEKHIQGVSQLEVIKGNKKKARDYIFAENNYHAAYEPSRAVRDERYKYIKVFHDYPHIMVSNIDASIPKEIMVEAGIAKAEIKKEYLFDLILDPNERNNLVDNARYSNVLETMRNKLTEHMQMTADDLETISIPKKGYAVCPPEAENPRDRVVIIE